MKTQEVAQHTPGPWYVENNLPGGPRIVHGKPLMSEDKQQEMRDDVDLKDQDNARLIATAPELLDALEVALDTLENGPQSIATSNTIPFIKEAIAKAEGR